MRPEADEPAADAPAESGEADEARDAPDSPPRVPASPPDTAAPDSPPAPAQQAPPDPAAPPDSPRPADETAALIHRLSAYHPLPAPREISLRVFPRNAGVLTLENGELTEACPPSDPRPPPSPDIRPCSSAAGALALRAPGFLPAVIPLPAPGETAEVKLERPRRSSEKIGELPTGRQPKSVRFSPDGRHLFTAHLADSLALTQYSVRPFRAIRHWQVPEEYRGESGFVETLILPNRGELWISQMQGSRIHVFDLESGRHLAVIPVSGRWPKVLLSSADESRVYVSCWDSGTVSEIDTARRIEIRSIPAGPVPRGMAFSPDGTELLVSRFADSSIGRIDLESGRIIAEHRAAPEPAAAMRHIVHDPRRAEYYITAMAANRVYRLSEDGRPVGSWNVGVNPNTAALTPDGRLLIVSSRGPNNPYEGYLVRGCEYGRIFFINLESGTIDEWIWGRDQPTGLAVDPSGRYLAFTNLLSDSLELYRLF